VAFSWDGGIHEGNEHIYIKVVGSDEPLRLTSSAARDFSPVWSPDGRSIAFMRFVGYGRAEIISIPALGGSEHKLGDTGSIATPPYFAGHQLAWSPDSKWLCFADREESESLHGLFLLSVTTGEKRRLTTPPSALIRDRGPSFSPNGRWLAFCRIESTGVNDLYFLHLSEAYGAKGEPRRFTFNRLNTTPVSWMADSQELYFSSGDYEGDRGIFRMKMSVTNQKADQVRLTGFGEDAYDLAISRDGKRLAYTKRIEDVNIWRVELTSGQGTASRALIASTRNDQKPQISPDDKRVSFSSGRSGTREIWVADADGKNAVQLTSLGTRLTTNAAWSPDGQQLAFNANRDGFLDIFAVSVRGGPVRRLTHGPAEQFSPWWSKDGKWIYFHSGKAGDWDIWKMPAGGGDRVRITRHGGGWPKESADGRTLYYGKHDQLWSVPVTGEREERVCEELIDEYNFAVTPHAIYFIPAGGTPLRNSIRRFVFATKSVQHVMRLDKAPGIGLTVSKDEKWLLYSQYDQWGSDLMLLENFR
jgi:Tol biopolymer transport system component